jgi:hypothetical protein
LGSDVIDVERQSERKVRVVGSDGKGIGVDDGIDDDARLSW